MSYINLLDSNLDIYPIFWENTIRNPIFLGMDDESLFMKWLTNNQIKDQKEFNYKINQYMSENNSDLVVSWFLEKRKRMFESLWFSQMVEERRFYHLWLDLSIKDGTVIYVPITWEVYEVWFEEWDWNYGWYIVLKHNIWWFIFYSLYWHQNRNNLPLKWTTFNAWDKLSIIWDFKDNWWYFYHLHLQLITQDGIDNWFINKWYIRGDEISSVNKYVLDPNYIFRY